MADISRTALRVELFEDRSHVTFDGSTADVQDGTDLLVASTIGKMVSDPTFTPTEFRVRHRFHQFQRDGRGEKLPPAATAL